MSTFTDVRDFMRVGQPEHVRDVAAASPPPAESWRAKLIRNAVEDLAFATGNFAGKGVLRPIDPAESATPSALGARLMLEELGETLQAMLDGDVVALADGLADLAYVVNWTAIAHGIDLDAVHAEVHRANIQKYPVCSTCGGHGCVGPPEPAGEVELFGQKQRISRWPTCATCTDSSWGQRGKSGWPSSEWPS